MPYRLVKINADGSLLTGDPMKEYLIGMDFAVPDYRPFVEIPRPTGAELDPALGNAVIQQLFNNLYQEWLLEDQQNRINFDKQYVDFAQTLAAYGLRIATRVPVGYTPQGQKIWGYVLIPTSYTFKQCAQKLIGYASPGPLDKIEFIANSYFG